MKGINGCKSFRIVFKTSVSTASAVSRVSSSLFQSLTFTISIYQSQNSSHAKSYIFESAIPSSNLSRFVVTSFISLFAFESIHLSESISFELSILPGLSSPMFIKISLAAFQILFAKFLALSTLS